MSKMGLHDPFGYLKHKLWPKERLGVKLFESFVSTISNSIVYETLHCLEHILHGMSIFQMLRHIITLQPHFI
jgi:hypothetical protein